MSKETVYCPHCKKEFNENLYMQECPSCRKEFPNEEFIYSLEYKEHHE